MSYGDFDLKKVRDTFQLQIVEDVDLFSAWPDVEISPFLTQILKQNVPLALAMGTEKARSELIIVNILLELKNKLNVSFFSGLDFNVDKTKGLNGFCDFIISQSSEQLFLNAPVIAMVEAKNENIIGGLGQCAAEMVAARIFNERENNPIQAVYGVVTTGHAWKFLKLQGEQLFIDVEDYYIKHPPKIMGILVEIVRQKR